ncbi:nucleotidyltransferase domain-containing protein [Diplocloster hominis]|uniref:nucleotidyltransferase family protein n=1 Tax=Diplocloster hominis TaxID=3079010 RepID=UPI0031BA4C8F
MNNRKYDKRVEQLISKVVELCSLYNAQEVVLFGSRAKDTARERSDIDIAVSGVSAFDELQEEIENIETLYTIDLVNLDDCRNFLLKEDIELYGCKIYEKV